MPRFGGNDMEQIKMQNLSEEIIQKVIVNKQGDCILINVNDANLIDNYTDIIQWFNEKQKELDEKDKVFEEKYAGQKMVEKQEDGTIDVNVDMLREYGTMRRDLFVEMCEKIEALLNNQNIVRKYFRACYEITEDFVPDEECIIDMVNSIGGVLETVFNMRTERISKKYNLNRAGRRAVKKRVVK